MISPRRGQIWIVDLGMAAKPRPAVVLSVPFFDEERALITYVPRTTSLRNTRFEVTHHARGFTAGAFDAQGLGSVPAVKLIRMVGELDQMTFSRIENSVKVWLGLD